MLRSFVKALKKLPFDLGQYELRYTTKGKLIAFDLVGRGEGKRALDIGCRDGFWSEKLKGLGYDVVSVDLEPKYPTGIAMDANQSFPFKENEFDLVWFTEVIEHLKDPLFTLNEVKRVLKPEGKLLLTTPNREMWIYKSFELFGVDGARIQSEDHLHFFSFSDIKKMLENCDTFGFFPYILVKNKIVNHLEILSPTIVVAWQNRKLAGPS